jgi:hypothetical protein
VPICLCTGRLCSLSLHRFVHFSRPYFHKARYNKAAEAHDGLFAHVQMAWVANHLLREKPQPRSDGIELKVDMT